MTHYMNLVPSAFSKIADGSKTIELRLNDEKRQKIAVEDTIVFNNTKTQEAVSAKVLALHKFPDFEALYKALPLTKCGYNDSELDTAHPADMEAYYPKEKIEKYGALGIELCEIYACESVVQHYDRLIDENNDPVHDPKLLRDYMDKWDGQGFIDKMQLDKDKTVLEIGVGTGRLAVRTASLCKEFCGIDISPKTINRANENLLKLTNVNLICGDFLTYNFEQTFDVICSSLTFMHIEEKQKAVNKVAELLKNGGRFVLSVDKNQDQFIDTGTRKIAIFPDTPEEIKSYIANVDLNLTEHYETEFSHIFVAMQQDN